MPFSLNIIKQIADSNYLSILFWLLKDSYASNCALYIRSLALGLLNIFFQFAGIFGIALCIKLIMSGQVDMFGLSQVSLQALILWTMLFLLMEVICRYFFYKFSYKVWANYSADLGERAVQFVEELPDPKYGGYNRYFFKSPEKAKLLGKYPINCGAFVFLSLRNIVSLIQISVVAAVVLLFEWRWLLIIVTGCLVLLPFILINHKKVAGLSAALDELNIMQLDNIQSRIRKLLTREGYTAERFQSLVGKRAILMTQTFMSQQQSHLLLGLLFVVFVVSFLYVISISGNFSLDPQQLAEIIILFGLIKILMSSCAQLSGGLIRMNRHYPQVSRLVSCLSILKDSIPATGGNSASEQIDIRNTANQQMAFTRRKPVFLGLADFSKDKSLIVTNLYIAFNKPGCLPAIEETFLLDNAGSDVTLSHQDLKLPDAAWVNDVMDNISDNKFVQLKICEYLDCEDENKQLTKRQQAYFNLLVGLFNYPKMLLITDNYLRYIELEDIENITMKSDLWLFICSFPKSGFAENITDGQQCIVETENKEFRSTIAKDFVKVLNKPKRKRHDTAIEFDEDF